MTMWGRIFEIVRKEFRQTLRNPRTRLLLFGPPLLQLIIFGFAVNLDVENTQLVWMDRDLTPESRELRAAFEGSDHFRIMAAPYTEDEVRALLDRGKAQAAVRVMPGFARNIRRGMTASVQVLVDGTNSNTASIVANYAAQIISAHAANASALRLGPRPEETTATGDSAFRFRSSALSARSRVWFNANLKSRDYFVPGVVVNIIALVTVMLTAMSIVREKELGTMEQLMVTPIRPAELILGKLLPFAVVGIMEVALVTSAALIVFRVPFRGSGMVLLGCSILFLLTTLGVGLFISTISQTQQQAMMASFFFFMPALMLSGFTFPIRNMPQGVQYLTYLNPVRYFMEIVRGVFLKGTGVPYLWKQMFALLALGVLILCLSALRFRKRLD